jgi:hypothetical protein
MNPRERLLAMIVLGFVVLGGLGFMAYEFVLAPIDERRASLLTLQTEVDEQQLRINQALALRSKLAAWKQLSLPADVDLSRREYQKYLDDLLRQAGFAPDLSTVTPKAPDVRTGTAPTGKKEPVYTRLVFMVQTHGTLDALVDLLERFYRTSLLHEIKNVIVTRPVTLAAGPRQQQQQQPQQRSQDLDITLTVEALVLAGAEKRTTLLPGPDRRLLLIETASVLQGGPAMLALVPWRVGPTGPLGPRRLATARREYAAIAGKNIFYGGAAAPEQAAEAVDVTQYVFLTDITRNDRRTEANLYNRYDNHRTRLRASAGFDSFRILDDHGDTVVQGTVVQINVEAREVVFRVGEKYYTLHVGQSIQQVLGKPLKEEEMRNLGLMKTAAKGK